jgi:hypothetical protein
MCGNRLILWKAWAWPYWPLAWLWRPVKMTEREALHEAVVQKALVKRTPSAAARSRFGILAWLSP